MRKTWTLLVLLAIACTPVRRRADGNLVRSISFEGNGGFFSGHNDLQLRAQMDQPDARFGLTVWPFVYFVDPKILDQDRLRRDAYRLEVWYAHHGWFDARVVGWDLHRARRESDRRAGVLDIHGVIETGQQSLVRAITVEGSTPEVQALVNAALRSAPIREGSPFDRSLVEATRQRILDNLLDGAHPYATVGSQMTAHPEERVVDLVFTVDPGITGRLGEVTIDGEVAVDERLIDQAAKLVPGDPYKYEALSDARRRLFEMSTFSIVAVEPDLSDATQREVPIRVQVTEAKFRTLRLGVGFDYDSYVPVLRASARLKHTNLFHELVQFDFGVRGGFAFDVTNGADFTSRRPTWGTDLTLEYPRLFLQNASLELRGEYEQDIYSGLWEYRRPEVDLSLVLRATDDIQFRWGPHYESYTFLGDFDPTVEAAQQRLFGIESQEAFRYELTALDHFFSYDVRNDKVKPTRGSFTAVSTRFAFALSDAGYSFVRHSVEHKRYVPLRAKDNNSAYPVTLAGRIRGTVVAPYLDTSTIPLPERTFLGGSTSIRGFRPNQVGPYTTLCTYREVTSGGFFWVKGDEITTEELVPYHLPSGGTASAELGTEIRYDWANNITLAGFVDTGILAQTLATFLADPAADFRWSGGVGFRYDTIIGPLRFDISARPLFAEDDGPVRYSLCRSEADKIPRINDFFSNFAALREDRHPPFALVLFITFGESL